MRVRASLFLLSVVDGIPFWVCGGLHMQTPRCVAHLGVCLRPSFGILGGSRGPPGEDLRGLLGGPWGSLEGPWGLLGSHWGLLGGLGEGLGRPQLKNTI